MPALRVSPAMILALIGFMSVQPFGSLGAQAATFTATASSQGCAVGNNGPLGSSATCGLAQSSSGPGAMRVFAGAAAIRTGGIQTNTGSSFATAVFSDGIFFGIDEGTFTIPLDFSGDIFLNTFGDGWQADATVSGGAGGTSVGFGLTALQSGVTTEITTFGTNSSITDAIISFTGGFTRLSGGLSARASCGNVSDGTSCSIEADFSSSLRLLGGTLRDLDGNIRNNVTVSSESGFDYLVGYEPHVRPLSPVPVPASLPLLAAGFGFLGFIGMRRKAKA